MLTNYKKNCEEVIKGRLESATRYKFENLQLENYKDFIVECNIEVVNTFSVTHTERCVSGGNKRGELYYRSSEYEQAIKNHCTNEYNDENFQLLVSNIQNGSYAKYADKSNFKYGATILCEYTCGKCNGKGEFKCDECRGKGEIRCNQCMGKGEVRCGYCGGKGEYRCGSCDGKGFDHQGISCRPCRGTGTRDCYDCKMTGWLRCSSCSGNGYKTCYKCKGRTILICGSCDGSGSVTDIAEICIQTTPKYNITYSSNTSEQIKDIIQANMVEGIRDIANINRVDIKVDNENKKVIESYKIQVPFAAFNLTFNDKQFDYIIYGKNLQIAKWHDDIVPTILANDLKVIAKIAKESSTFNKKVLQKSQVAVANFMESQINQNIIDADSKVDNEKYKKIDDRVSQIQNSFEIKAVSDEYVRQTIESLYKIANNFCLNVLFKYFSLAFLIGFILTFCFNWYGIFASFFIFYAFLFIVYAKQVSHITKHLGKFIKDWAIKREIINNDKQTKYWLSIFGVIMVYVAVYLTNNYVINFDRLKDGIIGLTQYIESSQSTQQKQTQPAKSAKQPAQNILRCDNRNLLKHLIKTYKNELINGYKDNPESIVHLQEILQKKGITLTDIEDYFVNQVKINITKTQTASSDEANKQISCKAEMKIIPHTQFKPFYEIASYRVHLKDDNTFEFEFLGLKN